MKRVLFTLLALYVTPVLLGAALVTCPWFVGVPLVGIGFIAWVVSFDLLTC